MQLNFKKILKMISLILLFLFLIFLGYFFIGTTPQAKEITWGVNFSQKHAKDLGLDWKETFLALLDDLKARHFKIAVHWDDIEPDYNPSTTRGARDEWEGGGGVGVPIASGERAPENKFYFDDLDWQIEEAEKRGARVFLVIGMKTSRWPECHLPDWAKNLSKEEQQKEILEMLEKIVLRYRDRVSVWAWQVENEPLFPFGICPWVDKEFVQKEVNLVKSLNPQKPVIMADSGEFSFWIWAAQLGDIPAITIYRKAWFKEIGHYIRYPLPSVFYWRKAKIIQIFFGKKVICGELQAEPFGPKLLYYSPLDEQEKTMNLEQFKKNIEFAKKTGFDTFYLWGSEWWYWMKEKQKRPEIWGEVQKLFQ